MAVAITADQLQQLAPSARSSYREAFQNGQGILDACGISAAPLRLAHFMAQVLHECQGLTTQFENLNYSAERLPKVWPSRFQPQGPLDPAEYAHNPEKLANSVYAGRNGNDAPGDGFKYRGRGLLQLTGKANYRDASGWVRQLDSAAPDFVADPDAVIGAAWCLAVAACKWQAVGCNALADADDIRRVTRAINGGQIGIAERMEWARRTKAIWS